jgi:DNA-directed RNA polymerase subunit RPC12/RpoP
MTEHKKRPLKLIETPSVGHVLNAPPSLTASTHTIDYTCGQCGAVLLHAEDGQVHGLIIRCSDCGSYNKTA